MSKDKKIGCGVGWQKLNFYVAKVRGSLCAVQLSMNNNIIQLIAVMVLFNI